MVRVVAALGLCGVLFIVYGVRTLLDGDNPTEGFILGAVLLCLAAVLGGFLWRRRRIRPPV